MDINPEEMEKQKQVVIDSCTCASCPSWAECGENGGFCFPTLGKSTCINEEKGCICGSCPVTEMLSLQNGYYCTKGSEKEQTK